MKEALVVETERTMKLVRAGDARKIEDLERDLKSARDLAEEYCNRAELSERLVSEVRGVVNE